MNGTGATNEIGVRWWLALVAVVSAGFLLWTFGELRGATDPKWEDTEGYLAHSLYIAEHGGFAGYLKESFAGTFPIVERHPLYMLMLAPFAERTADFFWEAKLFNLASGLVALLTLVWMVAQRYGRGAAVLAGLLYAVSNSLVVSSSHVNHEPQLMFCMLWTWWFLTVPDRGSRLVDAVHGTGSPAYEMPRALSRWALAGMWLGLAYMVKSSVILVAVAIVVAGLWRERLRFLASPRIWVLLVVAIVVASPLLVRNVRAHGTPIYEGINSHIMWLDDWRQLGNEDTIIYYDNYGVHFLEKNGLPTAGEYLRTHSFSDIARRMTRGVADQITRVTIKAVSPAFDAPTEGLRNVWGRGVKAWGLAVLVLAVAGWWLRRGSWEATLIFSSTGAFLAFFSWNIMFPVFRYWAPLVPVWISLAAYALWVIAQRLFQIRTAWRVESVAVATVVILLAGWTATNGALTRPQPVLGSSVAYLRLIAWTNRSIEPGDRLVLGPTREFYGLGWMVERPAHFLLAPNVETLAAFLRSQRERKARFIVMNPDVLERSPAGLQAELAEYVAMTPDGSIVERQPLPGWRVVYRDPGMPSRFIVYETVSGFSDG